MVTAQRSFVGGVNHPHAAGTRGIEETAQIRDDAGAVSGQCRQNGIGAKYAVLAFHTNDGDGGGIETPWVSRRLGLLDSDQGLVGPVCIVESSFELGRWDISVVAV
ncbi:hypothetical protein MOKP101_47910 [Mycobacterium avium subsp. hominissuis]